MPTFLDFDIRIHKRGRGSYDVSAETRADGRAGPERLDWARLNHPDLQEKLRRLQDEPFTLNRADLRRAGSELFAALFSGQVLRLFTGLWDQQVAKRPDTYLRLRLDIDERAPEVAVLPWELMYWRDLHLGTQVKTLVTRQLLNLEYGPIDSMTLPGRPAILLIIPSGSGLHTDEEQQDIKETLTQAGFDVDLLSGDVTVLRLADALARRSYAILHFIGHGDVTEEDEEWQGMLRFNAPDGGPEWVGQERLQSLLSSYSPGTRLVVLNGCLGSAIRERRAVQAGRGFVGLAPALLKSGIPAVVAMQYEIGDGIAIQFARSFYQRLSSGQWAGHVDIAVALARNDCFLVASEDRGFATPVLYLRAADGLLFDLPQTTEGVVTAPAPVSKPSAPPKTGQASGSGGQAEGALDHQEKMLVAIDEKVTSLSMGVRSADGTQRDSPHFFVPFSRRKGDFVGREDLLASMHLALSTAAPDERLPLALTGMGGIGKTELAVEYVYRYRKDYSGGVFWINGAEDIPQRLGDIGYALRSGDVADQTIESHIKVLIDHLNKEPDSLLVIDDVREPALIGLPLRFNVTIGALPCHILFTCRTKDVGRYSSLEVGVLSEETSLDLLLRHKTRRSAIERDHAEDLSARQVCRMLGWLPLALEIAGAFLGKWSRVTLADFRQRLLQDGRLATLDREGADLNEVSLREVHEAGLDAVFREQWRVLTDRNAKQLFKIAGQLPESAQIPIARLGMLSGMSSLGSPGNPSPLERAIVRLQDASLIEVLREGEVRLHPLLHEFARVLIPSRKVNEFRRSLAERLAASYDSVTSLEEQLTCRGLRAVEGDLTTAIELKANEPFGRQLEPKRLLVLLRAEAQHLLHWNREVNPAFAAQQLYNQCVRLGDRGLANLFENHLDQISKPYLALQWSASDIGLNTEDVLIGHTDSVRCVAISVDGRTLVSSAYDFTVRVWDLERRRESRVLFRDSFALLLLPDNSRLLLGDFWGSLYLYDLAEGTLLWSYKAHESPVFGLAIDNEGRTAFSASGDGSVKVWDIENKVLVATLQGHKGPVRSVAYLPSLDYLASGGDDGSVRIWDFHAGDQKHVYKVSSGIVHGVAVRPRHSQVIAAANDGLLTVLNVMSDAPPRVLQGHTSWVFGVAVSVDGQRAVSVSDDGTVRIWNLETYQEEQSFSRHGARVLAAVFTPDGQEVVSASEDTTLRIWNLNAETASTDKKPPWNKDQAVAIAGTSVIATCETEALELRNLKGGEIGGTLSQPDSRVLDIAVSSSTRRVVAATKVGSLYVWRENGQEFEAMIAGHSKSIARVALSLDGGIAYAGYSDGDLSIWDLRTKTSLATLAMSRKDPLVAFANLHSSDWLAWGNTDGFVIMEHYGTPPLENLVLRGHKQDVRTVAITRDGTHALSSGDDATIKLWDLRSEELSADLLGHEERVRGLTVTADGRFAISVSDDRSLRVWNLAEGSQVAVRLQAHDKIARDVVILPDNSKVISASYDGTIKTWDFPTLHHQNVITNGAGEIYALALLPDGDLVASGANDGKVRLWNYRTLREENTLYDRSADSFQVFDLAVSLNGKLLSAASSDAFVRVWDVASGHLVHKCKGHQGTVHAVAFSNDGGILISGSADHTIRFWDMVTGQELRALVGHRHWVSALAVTPDGESVLSASGDETIKRWSLRTMETTPHAVLGRTEKLKDMAFAGESGSLVTVSELGFLKIFDLSATFGERQSAKHDVGLSRVAVTPDGLTALASARDRSLLLYDLGSMTIEAVAMPGEFLLDIALSSNGDLVAIDILGRVYCLRCIRPKLKYD